MPSSFLLPFIKKEQVAKDTWSFYFDRTKNSSYNFLAGQYTKIMLPIHATDGKGSYRFFTTASSPLEKQYLMITIRINLMGLVSDFKQTLFNLPIGTEVSFEGPLGGFFLDENKKTQRILLAGGIGITPFHSMLMYVSAKRLSIPITLIAGFSSTEDMVFKDELETLVDDEIKILYTTEKLNSEIIKENVKSIQKPIYMVSGPIEMINATVEMLEQMGVKESNIKTDIFTGY